MGVGVEPVADVANHASVIKRYSTQLSAGYWEMLAERSKIEDQILEYQKLMDIIKQAIREIESEKEIEKWKLE